MKKKSTTTVREIGQGKNLYEQRVLTEKLFRQHDRITQDAATIREESEHTRADARATRARSQQLQGDMVALSHKFEETAHRCLGTLVCPETHKLIHETIESAQMHCDRLKREHGEHCYRFYACEHSVGVQHYHVATTNASVGSLIRSGQGMYRGVERRSNPRDPMKLEGGVGNMLVQVVRRIHADRGCVLVWNPGKNMLEMRYAYGLSADLVQKYYWLPVNDQTASGTAFKDCTIVMHENVDAASPDYRSLCKSIGINATLAVPALVKGQAVAVLSLVWGNAHHFSAMDVFKMTAFANQIGRYLVDNAQMDAELMASSATAGK